MPPGSKRPNPQLGSKKNKSLKARVNEHEKALAEKLGGIRQPNSGALHHRKGDIKLKDFLLDSKETEGGLLQVSAKDLTKITRESDGEGLAPGLILTFGKIPSTVSNEWALIPLSVFSDLLGINEDGIDG